ncbi:MAG: hypothetical protein PHV34_17825 [Verrucomicrobiae bacterium]|nr:hypothetical protein [Verrucomicrobiae bacterium]
MLLPPPERSHEIHFYAAKSLPYRRRIVIAFSLLAAGLLWQLALLGTDHWGWGLPGVGAGILLLLVKGYQNKPQDTLREDVEWKTVTRKEAERILEINKQQRQWDQSAIDVTCGQGCAVLIFASVFFLLLCGALSKMFPTLTCALFFNGMVMLLPFWITGIRSILKNDRLIVKTNILLRINDLLNLAPQEGEEFQFQIQTIKARDQEGEVPADIKAVIHFHNAPPSFLGLQAQVTINEVQGSSYPYFYCVLVARGEFGGLREDRLQATPPQIILESKREKDVGIIVIRQNTAGGSGYHTKDRVIESIFTYAMDQARLLIGTAKS